MKTLTTPSTPEVHVDYRYSDFWWNLYLCRKLSPTPYISTPWVQGWLLLDFPNARSWICLKYTVNHCKNALMSWELLSKKILYFYLYDFHSTFAQALRKKRVLANAIWILAGVYWLRLLWRDIFCFDRYCASNFSLYIITHVSSYVVLV